MSDKEEKAPELHLEEAEMDQAEEVTEIEEDPSETIFDGGKGYVAKNDFDRISQQNFYGTRLDDGRLELEPVEVLHLIERKRINVRAPDGNPVDSKYIINSLLSEEPDLWIR